MDWWADPADAHLIVGVYTYGYGSHDALRRDPKLMFRPTLTHTLESLAAQQPPASDPDMCARVAAAREALAPAVEPVEYGPVRSDGNAPNFRE